MVCKGWNQIKKGCVVFQLKGLVSAHKEDASGCRWCLNGINRENSVSGGHFGLRTGDKGVSRHVVTNVEPDPSPFAFPEPELRSEALKVVPVEGGVFQ